MDPLAIPDAVRDKSLKGAEAAVRHYFDMYNHLIQTGDAKPIKKLYGPRCGLCDAFVGLIEMPAKTGSTFTGRDRVRSTDVYSTRPGQATVVVESSISALTQTDRNGKRVFRLPPDDDVKSLYNFVYQRGFWELLSIEAAR